MSNVRALLRVAKVAAASDPYDCIQLKIYYPDRDLPSECQERGIVPSATPYKVVIFFNGIDCNPQLYQWLAIELAARGLVVVTFAWVAETFAGVVALTPGIDIQRLTPDRYGTGATASALPTLLSELERVQAEGVLAGLLDLERITLGGHSAGGRVAIDSADPRFFPQVGAAFAYGAHTAAVMALGFPANTILSLPDRLPLLLIGGSCDGVIANNSHRYGVTWQQPTTPVERTFHEAIGGGRKDSYLLLLEGANHFSIADPLDTTVQATALDFPATSAAALIRERLATSIGLFIDAHVHERAPAGAALMQMGALDAATLICK